MDVITTQASVSNCAVGELLVSDSPMCSHPRKFKLNLGVIFRTHAVALASFWRLVE